MKCLLAAFLLPAFLGAAASPPSSDAGETIRLSRTGLVWGWVDRQMVRTPREVGIEKIRFRVTPAEAARFRAILYPYRPTRISRARIDCARPSDAALSRPIARFHVGIVAEISWLGFGSLQSVVTCDDDPSGLGAVLDQALQALRLNSKGHRIEPTAAR